MLFVCQSICCNVENVWWQGDRVTWWHDNMMTWSFSDDWPYGILYIFILYSQIPLWQLQPARGSVKRRPLPPGCSEGGKVAGLGPGRDKMGKRSQWTVMCVALGFFSSCLILGQCKNISWFILNLWMGISLTMSPCAVGGMLSVTSEYQDRAIARMLNISIEELRTSS